MSTQDLVMQLSKWELRFEAPERPEVNERLKPLRGSLWNAVRRELSWWALEEREGKPLLVVELVKKEHRAWTGLWKAGLSSHRKQHFGWNNRMKAPVKTAEEMLVKVSAGRPARSAKDPFVVSRELLCSGYDVGQSTDLATFRIFFDREAAEKVEERCCLGELFGVDVMENYLKIYIRGDERSPICMGQLGGSCTPDKTRWELVKTSSPSPEEGMYLQVDLFKAPKSRKTWNLVISENEHALQRDAAPETIEELRKLANRPASPDRSSWTPQQYAQDYKSKGDACFKEGKWRDASVFYTRAIDRAPEDEKLYSNRSACYARMKKFDKALADARKCTSLNAGWPKAYFRQGQALRGLERFEDARASFSEGLFRDPDNPDWDKEIEKTDEEERKHEERCRELRKQKRQADLTTQLNETTALAQLQAIESAAEQALVVGKSKEEMGQFALERADLAKKQVHEAVKKKHEAMVIEDDKEPDEAPPYRIVCEDGTLHKKGFAHTDKGMYYMGMVMMNYESEPQQQPWVEIRHPGKLRWSQGCSLLRLKVFLPDSVKSAADVEVSVTTTHLRVGTVGDTDPVVDGELERRADPDGANFSWYMIPDEKPPMLEMVIDKDPADIYQTYSYGTLLWPRLFQDDVSLGSGLFEADLTDLPPELLEKFRQQQAKSNQEGLDRRARHKKMTPEEIEEESARNHNDEFRKHGMGLRMPCKEEEERARLKY